MHALSRGGNPHRSSCLPWSWPLEVSHLVPAATTRMAPGMHGFSLASPFLSISAQDGQNPFSCWPLWGRNEVDQILRETQAVLLPQPPACSPFLPGLCAFKGGLRSYSISNTCETVRNAEPRPNPGPTDVNLSQMKTPSGFGDAVKCVGPILKRWWPWFLGAPGPLQAGAVLPAHLLWRPVTHPNVPPFSE